MQPVYEVRAIHALTAADAADRAGGIVRVRVDDETVERVAEAIKWQLADYTLPANFPLNTEYHIEVAERCAPFIAHAVLAALRGESVGRCHIEGPETAHEDEGYSCTTHNMPWDECPHHEPGDLS